MSNRLILILAGVLLLISLFGWQNVMELRAEEPRRAIVSLEMTLTGDYVVPHINGWPYYNKPPVFNWVMATFYKVFGSYDEWVVRLPSLLSLLGMALIIYSLGRRFLSENLGILAAFFFITCGEVLLYGSVNSGEIDPFYSLIVMLQVLAIFLYYRSGKWWKLFLLSYTLMAVGFLTKGMPSIAFQALTLLAMVFYERKWKWLISVPHIAGMLAAFLIGFLYFYFYGLQEDTIGFLVRQFKEASQRTGLETDAGQTILQTAIFPLLIAKLLLPWSLLAVYFFRKGFIGYIKRNPLILFSVLFILFNIPIYWISGDFKPRYYYMFLPFFTLLLAYFYGQNREAMPGVRKMISVIFGMIVVILPLALFSLLFIPELENLPNLISKVIFIVLIACAAAIIFFKAKNKMVAMILVMAVFRLGLNLFYLPSFTNSNGSGTYRSAADELIAITGEEQVYISGHPFTIKSDASIGPFTFKEVTLITTPDISYQIPYYIARKNGHVLQYDPEIKEGRYYLVPDYMYRNKKMDDKVLYELRDGTHLITYFLIHT